MGIVETRKEILVPLSLSDNQRDSLILLVVVVKVVVVRLVYCCQGEIGAVYVHASVMNIRHRKSALASHHAVTHPA